MKFSHASFLFLILSAACSPATKNVEQTSVKPNIIYILADDLGYGDLSSYGQTLFETPNIDQLATQGMRFTQHYAGTTVCAPSRSSLMTGLHTGHTYIRGNRSHPPEGQWPIPDSVYTVAEMLKEAGYATGAFGKWGLGSPGSEGDPNNQGFDEFFGYNCQSLAHNYYPYHLWHNQEKIILEENQGTATGVYAPDMIHQKALEFIEKNKDQTFFLYYPSVIPHAELVAPEKYMEKYRGKYLPEKIYEGVDDGEKFRKGPYGSQEESHAAFVAMINILDDQIGDILNKVRELGLEENTIVLFSSDNGPHLEGGADPDYFNSNGPLKGYKRDLYEGGIRVPFIVSWPGKIMPKTQSEHISAFWDILPTFAEIAGKNPPANIDGISFLPALLGQKQPEHEYLYWEFHERGGRQAVRQGNWKLVRYDVLTDSERPAELYDLSTDPGEEHDLASINPDKVQAMEQLMNKSRVPSEIFKFGDE